MRFLETEWYREYIKDIMRDHTLSVSKEGVIESASKWDTDFTKARRAWEALESEGIVVQSGNGYVLQEDL